MADKEAIATMTHGMVIAAAIWSARELINNRAENLTPEKIARGAFNYSGSIGWLPMVVDPVLESLGADASISGYSSRGAGSILSLPASFGVIDRLLHFPGAASKFATGNASNEDIRVMQTTPIIGNAYGVNALLNGAKD